MIEYLELIAEIINLKRIGFFEENYPDLLEEETDSRSCQGGINM
jgi:hypothetical protein